MKTELYKTSADIEELVSLSSHAYEQIFTVFKDDEFYAYNLLKTVNIPSNLHEDVFYYATVVGTQTWTQLSYTFYGTIRLWWFICLVNKIMNPVILPESGTVLRIIKPEYVNDILDQISAQS